MQNFTYKIVTGILVISFFLTANSQATELTPANSPITLTVYKSPTCGCCEKWITHLKTENLLAEAIHPPQMSRVKSDLGIAAEHRSCHTAVSPEGYLFEGHVPAKFIREFLASPPANAIGLAVPDMPAGSPGMEMGSRFDAYEIIQLNRDGSSEVYRRMKNYTEQFE